MWKNKTISVVLPVYNEEKSVLTAINDFFETGYVDEIVVVDNNSKDRSAEIIGTTSAHLVTEAKQGYGHALRRGMQEAKGDLIILAEPDGTFIGGDILKLLVYSDDFDMVMGTRTTPQLIWNGANMGKFLRYGNWIVAKMLSFLFNTSSLSDCGCTMRLLHRESAKKLCERLTVGGSHLLPEMVILAQLMGFKMIEIPIHYRERIGKSKITGSFMPAVRVGMRMIFMIISYRIRSLFFRDEECT
ncbi:MAG: hypothetical protein AUJ11_00080 [Parcubacteria group bacterium CG1_02_44_65]|nr:MAG: hypothetical protein AUJ11_00080 [Parcubacteria group bacterium CG1_02_44_65]